MIQQKYYEHQHEQRYVWRLHSTWKQAWANGPDKAQEAQGPPHLFLGWGIKKGCCGTRLMRVCHQRGLVGVTWHLGTQAQLRGTNWTQTGPNWPNNHQLQVKNGQKAAKRQSTRGWSGSYPRTATGPHWRPLQSVRALFSAILSLFLPLLGLG